MRRDLTAARERLARAWSAPYEVPPIVCHPADAPAVAAWLHGTPVAVPTAPFAVTDPAALDETYLAAMFAGQPPAALAPVIELGGRRG